MSGILERVFVHYRSTLAGIALAVANVILHGRSGKEMALAITTAILGAIFKDN